MFRDAQREVEGGGVEDGGQELPYESLVWEDLHSPGNYLGVGLEDTRNIGSSKSMSNAESFSRDQDSNISNPEGDIEHTVNDRSENFLYPNSAKCCTCITCQELGVSRGYRLNSELKEACGIEGCTYMHHYIINSQHQRDHFKKPGGYACAEQGCHFVNKKFLDLHRHYTSKHCTNPNAKNLQCPEIGCEYKTARKDKLKEHQKCKHMGKSKLGKTYRVIKPAISSKPVSGTSGVAATD